MDLIRELKIDVVTSVAVTLGKSLAKMSDTTMLRLLKSLRALIRDPGMREGLDEVIDAVGSGPPNTATLKRLLRESRHDEIREFIAENLFYKEIDLEDI